MLFLIVGKKRTGKDTIADILQKEYKIKHRFALADALKDFVKLEHNISSQDLLENKELHRPRLVATGDNFKKIFGECFFSEVIGKKIQTILNENTSENIIITDVRLQSEFDYFQIFDNISIKISCENKEESNGSHRTETESENINTDICITNKKDGIENLTEEILDKVYTYINEN